MFKGLTFFGIELSENIISILLRLIEFSAILSISILIAVYIWYKIDERKVKTNFKKWLHDTEEK